MIIRDNALDDMDHMLSFGFSVLEQIGADFKKRISAYGNDPDNRSEDDKKQTDADFQFIQNPPLAYSTRKSGPVPCWDDNYTHSIVAAM